MRRFTAPLKDCIVLAPFLWKPYAVLMSLALRRSRCCSPRRSKALREQLRLSQPVFARYLNTSVSTIQKWETGVKRPGGVSLKLLSIVRKHGLEVLL